MLRKLKAQVWQSSSVLWITPGVTALVLILKALGWLQPAEWWALDQLFCFRPQEAPDPRIVVVEIQEYDVRQLGHPLSDQILADLLKKIRVQKPVAIGLDLYRDLPVPQDSSQYAAIAKVFQTTPNLIGISKITGNVKDPVINPPPILKQNGQVAANDVMVDFDGRLRRGFLYLPDPDDNNVLGLGFQLALRFLEQHGQTLKVTEHEQLQIGSIVFPPFSGHDGGYVNAEAGGYQVLVNYRGNTDQFTHASVSDVLNGKVPKTLFRDRIVLIGSVAESLKDFFYSPYSNNLRYAGQSPPQLPGVYYHANLASHVISSVLNNRPILHTWPKGWDVIWIIAWTGLGTGISWVLRPGSPLRQSRMANYLPHLGRRHILLPIAVLSLVGISYGAFLQGWWLPLIPPILGLAGSAIAVTSYIAHTAEQIRKTFGRYVTDDVVHSLLETPDGMRLGGERRTVSILMSDIRGFSAISERFSPEQVITFLNIYLEIMADVITTYQGTIDEFIGDAILVIFGAPTLRANDAERAVACAVAMQLAMAEVNKRIQPLGIPELRMGIAINTGEVVVGNIGSTKRAKYGVVGSHVNLTGRIEGFTEGGQILIAQSTFDAVEPNAKIERVLPIQPKGFHSTMNVYDVVGIGASYNLFLPEKDKNLVNLAQPLPVKIVRLENKHVVGGVISAQLTHLSAQYARIQVEHPLPLLSDLRLNISQVPNSTPPLDDVSEISGVSDDVYVKIVKTESQPSHECLIAFTEIPPSVKILFARLLTPVT
jgi:adenylate cyclase